MLHYNCGFHRFTPTCVGTTPREHHIAIVKAVHPHVCGDNSNGVGDPVIENGSPPRVWGQLERSRKQDRCQRFTPTCVGTTLKRLRPFRRPSVHPHVCGDNVALHSCLILPYGSPPRVWGQPAIGNMPSLARRFTPTCVGTTFSSSSVDSRATVHPHVCGDNSTIQATKASDHGSPPRVWGQPRPDRQPAASDRFTPTCVGTTNRSRAQPVERAVHPHVCGDNHYANATC